jgi:hypothetical protein
MNNAKRSNRFEVAIMSLRDEYDDDVHTALIDFLTDAMHWCDRNGDVFERCLRLARDHHWAETHGEE